MIVVCGEALVDLLPAGGGLLAPRPGGGPANVAVALGRLGVPVSFLGRFAQDGFGTLSRDRLAASSVDVTTLARQVAQPSTLAVATVDVAGSANYGFYVEGTADFGWRHGELPGRLPSSAEALVAGTLALVVPPGAAEVQALLRRAAASVVVCVDPNVRPALAHAERYRESFAQWLPHAAVVKVSDDDLRHVYPDDDPMAVAAGWAQDGRSVVAVTTGAAGATAFTPHGCVTVPAVPVDVVDTVGAGDAFTGGLLDGLRRQHRLSLDGLAALTEAELTRALQRAVAVAAATCARQGADPPWERDLQA